MKKLFLYTLFFIGFFLISNCSAQTRNIDFKYIKTYYKEGKIGYQKTYDSKLGQYIFNENIFKNNGEISKQEPIVFYTHFNQKNKENIYQFYKKMKKRTFKECLEVDNV